MKKQYILAAFAVLSVSCTDVFNQNDIELPGSGDIELSFECIAPQTKATSPGEDKYNENTIRTIDYFIYTDANGASLAKHGRLDFTGDSPIPTGTASKTVDMNDYPQDNGYVYAIANYPDATIHDSDNANLTVAKLRLLTVETNFSETTNTSNPREGQFKPQESFVMTSWNESGETDLIQFSITRKGVETVHVPLSRRAAKITIDINVAKWLREFHVPEGSNTPQYVMTWIPNISNVQVYMMYYNRKTTLAGTPTYYTADYYKSYERKAFIKEIDSESDITIDATNYQKDIPATVVTGTPFYSYPTKWERKEDAGTAPFIKVILEWSSYLENTTPKPHTDSDPTTEAPDLDNSELKQINKEFYYKITIPDEVDLKSNNWYKITLDLAVLGSEADDASVEIKGEYSVVKWSDPEDAIGGDLNAGRFLTVSGNKVGKDEDEYEAGYETFKVYGDVVDIPIITSHPFKVVTSSPSPGATYPTFKSPYDDGSLTYTDASASGVNYTITPSTDYSYVTLEHERIKDVNSSSFGAKDVAPITYRFRIQHSDDGEDAEDYYRDIKVIQYPSIYLYQMPGGNVFLDGYFQYLDKQPVDFTNAVSFTWRSGNATYQKAGYRSAGYGGDSFGQNVVNNGSVSTTPGNSSNNGYHNLKTPYGHLGYDDGLPTKMTLITVTAFSEASVTYKVNNDASEEYKYAITDPRENQNWQDRTVRIDNNNVYERKHLAPYLTGQSRTTGNVTLSTTNWTSTEEDAILVGSRENKNYIAPAFLISSRWGRPGGSSTFPRTLQQAEQRCATYQEAGYPAGRWRLPTEAEIYFVYTLQEKGLVDGLFTGSGQSQGYWASSGRNFAYHNQMYFDTPDTGSIRCVYDYWYWEEKDKSVYKFTPKP